MKKFHVFAGDTYYPTGFEDYVGSYKTYDQALGIAYEYERIGKWTDIVQTADDGSLIRVPVPK